MPNSKLLYKSSEIKKRTERRSIGWENSKKRQKLIKRSLSKKLKSMRKSWDSKTLPPKLLKKWPRSRSWKRTKKNRKDIDRWESRKRTKRESAKKELILRRLKLSESNNKLNLTRLKERDKISLPCWDKSRVGSSRSFMNLKLISKSKLKKKNSWKRSLGNSVRIMKSVLNLLELDLMSWSARRMHLKRSSRTESHSRSNKTKKTKREEQQFCLLLMRRERSTNKLMHSDNSSLKEENLRFWSCKNKKISPWLMMNMIE